LSTSTYNVYDEFGNAYGIGTDNTSDLADYLVARGGSEGYYFWGNTLSVKFNNFINNIFYIPTMDGQTNTVKFPVGKHYYTGGPSGSANYTVISNKPGSTPSNTNGPSASTPTTQNINATQNINNFEKTALNPQGSNKNHQNITIQ
jgi:hypothetical protein